MNLKIVELYFPVDAFRYQSQCQNVVIVELWRRNLRDVDPNQFQHFTFPSSHQDTVNTYLPGSQTSADHITRTDSSQIFKT